VTAGVVFVEVPVVVESPSPSTSVADVEVPVETVSGVMDVFVVNDAEILPGFQRIVLPIGVTHPEFINPLVPSDIFPCVRLVQLRPLKNSNFIAFVFVLPFAIKK
jgi:hypothetical protein